MGGEKEPFLLVYNYIAIFIHKQNIIKKFFFAQE